MDCEKQKSCQETWGGGKENTTTLPYPPRNGIGYTVVWFSGQKKRKLQVTWGGRSRKILLGQGSFPRQRRCSPDAITDCGRRKAADSRNNRLRRGTHRRKKRCPFMAFSTGVLRPVIGAHNVFNVQGGNGRSFTKSLIVKGGP